MLQECKLVGLYVYVRNDYPNWITSTASAGVPAGPKSGDGLVTRFDLCPRASRIGPALLADRFAIPPQEYNLKVRINVDVVRNDRPGVGVSCLNQVG